jgi:alpha-beta hydrolase superfamily lysophospholipase
MTISLHAKGLTATALALCLAGSALAQTPSAPQVSVVLVHGAFANSSISSKVIASLRKRGVAVIAMR